VYFDSILLLEFLQKSKYSVNNVDNILPSPPELSLLKNNLTFGFAISFNDNSTLVPDEILKKYLVEKVYFVRMLNSINSTTKTKKEISFKPCEKAEFYSKYIDPDKYYSVFSNMRCLNERNFTLMGSYTDEVFQYIEYGIYLNYTTFQEEKMTFANNFFSKNLLEVSIQYFDMSININDYKQPLTMFVNSLFDYIGVSKIKKTNLDFSQFTFNNDAQIFSNTPESETFVKLISDYPYSYDMFDRQPPSKDNDLLMKYFIRSSAQVKIINRSYDKLWTLLANITGITSDVLICIVFVNTFYNKIKFKEELVNNLLKFKDNYNVNESNYSEIKKLKQDYYMIIESANKKIDCFANKKINNNDNTATPSDKFPVASKKRRLTLRTDTDLPKIVSDDSFVFEKQHVRDLNRVEEADEINNISVTTNNQLQHQSHSSSHKINATRVRFQKEEDECKSNLPYCPRIFIENIYEEERNKPQTAIKILKNDNDVNFKYDHAVGNISSTEIKSNEDFQSNKNNLEENSTTKFNNINNFDYNEDSNKDFGAAEQNKEYQKYISSRKTKINDNNVEEEVNKDPYFAFDQLHPFSFTSKFEIPNNVNNDLNILNKTSHKKSENKKSTSIIKEVNNEIKEIPQKFYICKDEKEEVLEINNEEYCNITIEEETNEEKKNKLDIMYSFPTTKDKIKQDIESSGRSDLMKELNFNSNFAANLINKNKRSNLKIHCNNNHNHINNLRLKNCISSNGEKNSITIDETSNKSNAETEQRKENIFKMQYIKESNESFSKKKLHNSSSHNENNLISVPEMNNKNSDTKIISDKRAKTIATADKVIHFNKITNSPEEDIILNGAQEAQETDFIKNQFNYPNANGPLPASADYNIDQESNDENKNNYIDAKKKIQINFNFIEIFCKCFCYASKRNAEKYKLYKQSFKSINDHLNIYFYLKMIQEMDIIKTLVFTNDHIGLLAFIAKPMICKEINSNLNQIYDSKNIKEIFNEELSLENALNIYRSMLKNNKLTEIDHKILKIFNYELDSILEKKSDNKT